MLNFPISATCSILHCDFPDLSSSFASTHHTCQYLPKPKIIKRHLAYLVIVANFCKYGNYRKFYIICYVEICWRWWGKVFPWPLKAFLGLPPPPTKGFYDLFMYKKTNLSWFGEFNLANLASMAGAKWPKHKKMLGLARLADICQGAWWILARLAKRFIEYSPKFSHLPNLFGGHMLI
jgi:hypothetical protein